MEYCRNWSEMMRNVVNAQRFVLRLRRINNFLIMHSWDHSILRVKWCSTYLCTADWVLWWLCVPLNFRQSPIENSAPPRSLSKIIDDQMKFIDDDVIYRRREIRRISRRETSKVAMLRRRRRRAARGGVMEEKERKRRRRMDGEGREGGGGREWVQDERLEGKGSIRRKSGEWYSIGWKIFLAIKRGLNGWKEGGKGRGDWRRGGSRGCQQASPSLQDPSDWRCFLWCVEMRNVHSGIDNQSSIHHYNHFVFTSFDRSLNQFVLFPFFAILFRSSSYLSSLSIDNESKCEGERMEWREEGREDSPFPRGYTFNGRKGGSSSLLYSLLLLHSFHPSVGNILSREKRKGRTLLPLDRFIQTTFEVNSRWKLLKIPFYYSSTIV